jgi:hypothetical protein
MNTTEKEAIAAIRAALKLSRLNPRRLFLVNDGAYRWLGDRSELDAKTASMLAFAHREGTRPDLITREEREDADRRWGADWYSRACERVTNIASVCGCGIVSFDELPEDWQDGSALGPIKPL